MKEFVWPRRDFLKTGSLALAGLSLASMGLFANAPNQAKLKIGVVGCGGRGMGAARDALEGDANVVIWAFADVFEEPMSKGVELLKKEYPQRVDVPAERRFLGLDGYKQLLASGVDVVLLCTPPAFRPQHLAAAVDASKHIYCEKPIATDVVGAQQVQQIVKQAEAKSICIYTGFCWRFDPGCRAAYEQLAEGKLGDVLNFYGMFYTVPPKPPLSLDARPEGISDMDWQIRNWTGYNWLSGGPLVEQAIHTIDAMSWAMKEELPLAVVGSGGRSQRKDQGDVWDHYDVVYEFPGRVFAHVSCRQWLNCYVDVKDRVLCQKGVLTGPYMPRIDGETRWKFRGQEADMYRVTHKEMFASIRAGHVVQELDAAVRKTMIALMGRLAAESGSRVTWQDITESRQSLVPQDLRWDMKLPDWKVPVPGK